MDSGGFSYGFRDLDALSGVQETGGRSVGAMETRFTLDRYYDVRFRNFNTDKEISFQRGKCASHLFAGFEGKLEYFGSSFVVPDQEGLVHVHDGGIIEASESARE